MAKTGPIILIDDDVDDQEFFKEILQELGIANELKIFNLCVPAFTYLKTTNDNPFIIFCDVNLPQVSGIEFKRQIDNDLQLRHKSIPFVFYSTSVDQHSVNMAYTQMTVQGFFKKGNNYQEIKKLVGLILEYWEHCQHPNSG
jgi:CheY-like chemotaxis protein